MKQFLRHFRLLLCGSLAVALAACDTERNTEDPDLSYFIKYYGGDGNQYGVDLEVLNDGTFLLLGNYSEDAIHSQIYLLHVSATGDIISELRYPENAAPEHWLAKDIEPTLDGNFIVLSDYQANRFSSQTDCKLLKFSRDLTLLAESEPLGTDGGNVTGLKVTPLWAGAFEGDFIVSGTTDSTRSYLLVGETDPDLADAFDLRVNSNLQPYSRTNWSPVYIGFDNIDASIKTFQVNENLFYSFGQTNSTLTGLNDEEKMGLFYYYRESDPDSQSPGNASAPWYPGNVNPLNDTEINDVQPVGPAFGGGYLVVGTSRNSLNVSEIFVARLRQTLTFQAPLQNDASLYTMIPLGRNVRGVAGTTATTGGAGYLILGNEVRTTDATNLWLTKIDQGGQVLWSMSLGSEEEEDAGAALRELADGKIAVLGTMGLANNELKMAFIKVNPQGRFLK